LLHGVSDAPAGADPYLRATPRRAPRAGRDPEGKRALFSGPPAAPAEPSGPGGPGGPAQSGPGGQGGRGGQDAPGGAGAPGAAVGPKAGAVVELPRRAAPGFVDGARLSDVDHWGRSEHMRELTRRLYDPLYRHWFRVEWEGLEHIPREGGALLVANHAGAIPSDAPVIMHGIETELGRPVYGLAEHLFKAMPVVGTLWARSGGVAAHPDNAYRLLHDEQQLALVFPEGTKGTGKHFSDRYKLARFGRGGFVEIAMRSGVPIVPIAVVGAEESMPILWQSRRLSKLLGVPYVPVTANLLLFGPLGALLYFPAKFRLRVLPPVTFDEPPDQERYSRARVMEAAEDIRRQIQNALYDMLRTRRSVWFG
jgi:1-acyl-sn-glycerol-3-phosphate acyltransferase